MDRNIEGMKSGIVGIVSNAVICVMKIAVGLIFSSISILADGINMALFGADYETVRMLIA